MPHAAAAPSGRPPTRNLFTRPAAGSARRTVARLFGKRRLTQTRRSGTACVLAMMYVVLLSALAVGFYASTTMAAQVSGNEARLYSARLAGESGMEFMRYQLGAIIIPAETHPTLVFDELYSQLKDRLGGTMNIADNAVGLYTGLITVPDGDTSYIRLEANGPQFRAEIYDLGQNRVRVKVIGKSRSGGVRWANQMEFLIEYKPTKVFDYGLATKGVVMMNSNSNLYGVSDAALGNILISNKTTNNILIMDGNSVVSGRIQTDNPNAVVQVLGSSKLGGSSDPNVWKDYVTRNAPPVEFPQIFTSEFRTYAGNPVYHGTTVSIPGSKYTSNVRNVLVRPNTNPIFDGGSVVEGVLYIQTPNVVTFTSSAKMRGIIVVQDFPTGTSATNTILFDGNTTLEGLEKLPVHADFPAALREKTGSLILAPKFTLHFNSNFGAAGGSIVGGKLYFNSNAHGQLNGALISLDEQTVTFNGNANVGITSRSYPFPAAGMYFKQKFLPIADTYQEVLP